jgi:hypothetical protein
MQHSDRQIESDEEMIDRVTLDPARAWCCFACCFGRQLFSWSLHTHAITCRFKCKCLNQGQRDVTLPPDDFRAVCFVRAIVKH